MEPPLQPETERDHEPRRLVAARADRRARAPSMRARVELLLELQGDDSLTVRRAARAELARLGRRARAALERAAKSCDAEVRARARQLLLETARERALRRLLKYAARPDLDLETALLLLARYHSPDRDLRPARRVLDGLGDLVRRRTHGRPAGLGRALALVEVLARDLGFQGVGTDTHHPDHIQLPRALEVKSGLPLTLCSIYVLVARRAGIEAGILPFPGHVLLRLRHASERVIVDPLSGGKMVSESACLSYLAQYGHPFRSEWFREASDRALFARQVRNYLYSCRRRGLSARVRNLVLLHEALEPGALLES